VLREAKHGGVERPLGASGAVGASRHSLDADLAAEPIRVSEADWSI